MLGSLGDMFSRSMAKQNPGAFGNKDASAAKGGAATTAPVTTTLGVPGTPAPTAGVLAGRAVPTAHRSVTLSAMDEDVSLGKPVNARDYVQKDYVSRQMNKANAYISQEVKSVPDYVGTQRAMSSSGAWNQNPGAHPLNMKDVSFTANRGVTGSILDAVTGKSRTVGLPEAVKAFRSGKAETLAASYASGNTETDEQGRPKNDVLGDALDVASPAVSAFRGSIAGALLGGVKAAYNLARDEGLYDDEKKSVSAASPAVSPTAQRTVSATAKRGAGEDSGRILMQSALAQGGKAAAASPAASAGSGAATTKAKRGRQSLLLTGGRGVEDDARVLFTGLKRG
ncbi:hypothetical protein [Pseudodesulfovibrio pelocollis]|uniref:hypothetical protein n=1 Tax=Pseudodesulfovibrio pelocollis TaxID=3051432 RepID=UPI00255A8C1E|nr:hypothetical protein [Pseudodesulfovibrio sp. SB368]